MGWSEVIQTEHGAVIACGRGGRRPTTWQCECKRRNTLDQKVCRKCGLYRDGCPLCDSDVIPAKTVQGMFEMEAPPFKPGVKRLHICSGNYRENKLPCGYEVMA